MDSNDLKLGLAGIVQGLAAVAAAHVKVAAEMGRANDIAEAKLSAYPGQTLQAIRDARNPRSGR